MLFRSSDDMALLEELRLGWEQRRALISTKTTATKDRLFGLTKSKLNPFNSDDDDNENNHNDDDAATTSTTVTMKTRTHTVTATAATATDGPFLSPL